MNLRSEVSAVGLALSFLTVLPVPSKPLLESGALARATAYFPVAGYAVGALVSLVLLLPTDAGVSAALAIAAWWALTGWLHFDGLVDSADALQAPVSTDKRADILKDVHVGAFALGTSLVTMLVMWSALAAGVTPWAPLVAAAVARALVLVPMRLYPTLEQDSLGGQARTLGWGRVAAGLAIAAPTLLVPGAWLGWLLAGGATALVTWWAAGRLAGRLSGDIYGLLITTAEVSVLVAFAF
ncbi:adenosylcobinamide-GDP ribazoletransferase [Ornithinimicrobium sp. Arc0846-15]|nr:adenosylcobinamide-GDP ribazoletransferase [Ornithinimicrobium laminariae]